MPSPLVQLCLVALCLLPGACLQTARQSPDSQINFWSSARGSLGSYSASSFSGPERLSEPSWTWQHPSGRWSTIPVGVSIDSARDIYLTAADGLRKFNADGKLLWTYRKYDEEVINNAAALSDGKAFCITSKGRAFALNMTTGEEVWSTSVGPNADGNYGQVAAHDGTLIVASDASDEAGGHKTCCGPANHKLSGVDTADGRVRWTYTPAIPVWNFAASFVGDGTFIFQDLEGRAHRNRVSDGTLIWKSGGLPGTWTDGGAMLGSNNVIYTVATTRNGGFSPGLLSAFRLDDGQMLWNATTPRPPNNIPAIGHLVGRDGLSVVQPMGQQCTPGQQVDVRAYDAETGALQWTFEGQKQAGPMVAGDMEGIFARKRNKIQPATMPNPFSAPAVDGTGTAYVGAETGHFYGLRDLDGDGKVDGPGEVSVLNTHGAFVGSMSPAMAPGLFAVGDIGKLYVWKTPMPASATV